jgi:hypothetical protein
LSSATKTAAASEEEETLALRQLCFCAAQQQQPAKSHTTLGPSKNDVFRQGQQQALCPKRALGAAVMVIATSQCRETVHNVKLL